MLEEDLKLDKAISEFVKRGAISEDELASFLTSWAAHPDYYVEFTGRVVKNLSALNVKLLKELPEDKRYHLLWALCLTVEVAFGIRQWEYMLGREDGAWYWNNMGLFFSALHDFIPHSTLSRSMSLRSMRDSPGESFAWREVLSMNSLVFYITLRGFLITTTTISSMAEQGPTRTWSTT
jgi:hypothetical protein